MNTNSLLQAVVEPPFLHSSDVKAYFLCLLNYRYLISRGTCRNLQPVKSPSDHHNYLLHLG